MIGRSSIPTIPFQSFSFRGEVTADEKTGTALCEEGTSVMLPLRKLMKQGLSAFDCVDSDGLGLFDCPALELSDERGVFVEGIDDFSFAFSAGATEGNGR